MAPNRSLTTSELTEAAVESEHAVAANEVEDASGLAEAVDEFGGESVLSETIGEDADELAEDALEDTSLDAANLQYGAIPRKRVGPTSDDAPPIPGGYRVLF